MNSNMDLKQHHECVQRAIALGRANDPTALPELTRLLKMPSAEIRRLAASAIGKLSGFGADPEVAVVALAPAALGDPHPQTKQYALKALKAYGAAASPHLDDLRDAAANPEEKEYVRLAAASAVKTIEEAVRIQEGSAQHGCQRCGRIVAQDEYARAQKMFQRTLCDNCFDETYIKRRNFDTRVEVSKTIPTTDGKLVQSGGEKAITEWLAAHGIAYRYDDRLRILEGRQVRPDFYLPELDVYIEYWGMDTLDYQIGMLIKKQMYQHAGKRLISLYPKDLSCLDTLLKQKLALLARPESAAAVPTPHAEEKL
ncbi:MAG: HEAT repeat domain-containing protein [Lentisphaerae bacterium]|nr:HEAT repeat domain-containing protein [Lentisphaerota bacterium]